MPVVTMMSQSWFSMLVEYCAKSDFNEALKAMDKAPFLQGVPFESKMIWSLIHMSKNGWKLLRDDLLELSVQEEVAQISQLGGASIFRTSKR